MFGNSTFSEIPEISIDSLKQKMREKKVIVIDVREPNEIEATGKIAEGDTEANNVPLGYVIQGAFNMENEEFKNTFGFDKPGKEDVVVFSCRSGARSLRAATAARDEFGYKNVLNYRGSANEWFSS